MALITKWLNRLVQRWIGSPNWRPLHGGPRGFYDDYNRQQEPSQHDLLRAFEDTAYACANLIAQNLAAVPLRLYVQTRRGDPKPKCATKAISGKTWQYLNSKQSVSVRKAIHLEEVVDHPLLELLQNPNDYLNFYDLIELTDLYQETAGNCFWFMERPAYDVNRNGPPSKLYPLPPHLVTIEKDDDNKVIAYKFGTGVNPKVYEPDEILHFTFLNLLDPFNSGYSPLRAAWERIRLMKKELAYFGSTLDNLGRPDAILSPADPNAPLGTEEAERLAKDVNLRFKQAGAGGMFVMPDAMKMEPLGWSPKDVGSIELYKYTKLQICNTFGVPISLLDTEASNRSVSEAGLYQLANLALNPRIRRLEESLNHKLVKLFDERLCLAFDDATPLNAETETQKRIQYVQSGILTRNEVRKLEGYDEEKWGEQPILPPGTTLPQPEGEADTGGMPLLGGAGALGEATDSADPANALRATVGGSAAIAALQTAYYAGQLPREAAVANATVVFGFSAAEAASLFPEVAPVKLTPEPGPEPAAAPQIAPEAPPSPAKAVGKAEAHPGDLEGTEPHQSEDKGGKCEHDKAIKEHGKDFKADPAPLDAALKGFFRRQSSAVIGKLKGYKKKAPVFDLADWDKELYDSVRPVMELYWNDGIKRMVADLGLTPADFSVTNPRIKEALDKWTLKFAESTNRTTALDLDTAHKRLKEELTEGMTHGEVLDELRKRVQEVYTSASNERAFTIALTESNRAVHAAEFMTAKESGVVKGKAWILSAQPCELCQHVAAAGRKALDEPFFTDDYGDGQHPPLHPHCFCSMEWITNHE